MADKGNPSKIEELKRSSNLLRGTIAEELADTSVPTVTEDSANLLKTTATYQQDDRDHRGDAEVLQLHGPLACAGRGRSLRPSSSPGSDPVRVREWNSPHHLPSGLPVRMAW